MKFATKPVWHYPPHLRHVATLPWEIKNSNFLQIFSRYGRKCKQTAFLIAFNFANRSPYWLQIKFLIHCCFICLLLLSICGTGNLSQQTINMVFSDEDKILINLQSVGGKTGYFKHQKYQNFWMNNKVRGNLNAICLHFCHICWTLKIG